jgi:hypothetical protein
MSPLKADVSRDDEVRAMFDRLVEAPRSRISRTSSSAALALER